MAVLPWGGRIDGWLKAGRFLLEGFFMRHKRGREMRSIDYGGAS